MKGPLYHQRAVPSPILRPSPGKAKSRSRYQALSRQGMLPSLWGEGHFPPPAKGSGKSTLDEVIILLRIAGRLAAPATTITRIFDKRTSRSCSHARNGPLSDLVL
jgi:hypothetical protein